MVNIGEDVFVAIKNGMHDPRGYCFYSKECPFPIRVFSHVHKLHNIVIQVFPDQRSDLASSRHAPRFYRRKDYKTEKVSVMGQILLIIDCRHWSWICGFATGGLFRADDRLSGLISKPASTPFVGWLDRRINETRASDPKV